MTDHSIEHSLERIATALEAQNELGRLGLRLQEEQRKLAQESLNMQRSLHDSTVTLQQQTAGMLRGEVE